MRLKLIELLWGYNPFFDLLLSLTAWGSLVYVVVNTALMIRLGWRECVSGRVALGAFLIFISELVTTRVTQVTVVAAALGTAKQLNLNQIHLFVLHQKYVWNLLKIKETQLDRVVNSAFEGGYVGIFLQIICVLLIPFVILSAILWLVDFLHYRKKGCKAKDEATVVFQLQERFVCWQMSLLFLVGMAVSRNVNFIHDYAYYLWIACATIFLPLLLAMLCLFVIQKIREFNCITKSGERKTDTVVDYLVEFLQANFLIILFICACPPNVSKIIWAPLEMYGGFPPILFQYTLYSKLVYSGLVGKCIFIYMYFILVLCLLSIIWWGIKYLEFIERPGTEYNWETNWTLWWWFYVTNLVALSLLGILHEGKWKYYLQRVQYEIYGEFFTWLIPICAAVALLTLIRAIIDRIQAEWSISDILIDISIGWLLFSSVVFFLASGIVFWFDNVADFFFSKAWGIGLWHVKGYWIFHQWLEDGVVDVIIKICALPMLFSAMVVYTAFWSQYFFEAHVFKAGGRMRMTKISNLTWFYILLIHIGLFIPIFLLLHTF